MTEMTSDKRDPAKEGEQQAAKKDAELASSVTALRLKTLSPMERSVQRTKYAFTIGLVFVQNAIAFNALNSVSCEEVQMGKETVLRSRLVPQVGCEEPLFSRLATAYTCIYCIMVFGIPLMTVFGHRLQWACFDWARILFRGRSFVAPLWEIYAYNLTLSVLTPLWTEAEFFTGKYALLIGLTVYRLLRFISYGPFRLGYLNSAMAVMTTYLTVLLLLLLGFGPEYSSTAQIILVIAVYVPFLLTPFLREKRIDSKSQSLLLKYSTSSAALSRTASVQSQSSSGSGVGPRALCPSPPSRSISIESLTSESSASSDQQESVMVQPQSLHSGANGLDAETQLSDLDHPRPLEVIHHDGGDFEIEDNLSGSHSVRT